VSTATSSTPVRFAVPERHRFRELQALEDAVNYRLARLMVPCAQCELRPAGDRCDEHACDVALIAGYLEAAQATMAALSAVTERQAGQEPVAGVAGDEHRA